MFEISKYYIVPKHNVKLLWLDLNWSQYNNTQLNLMAKEDSPVCISCGVHNNIKDTFTECYVYSQSRKNSKFPKSLNPFSIFAAIKFIITIRSIQPNVI